VGLGSLGPANPSARVNPTTSKKRKRISAPGTRDVVGLANEALDLLDLRLVFFLHGCERDFKVVNTLLQLFHAVSHDGPRSRKTGTNAEEGNDS
jgi:hypothetical protein